jgi:hypothetical protein
LILILLWIWGVVFRSFTGAVSPLFSWLFPCWCHPKALSPGVSSPPILSVEQHHHAPKFQLFPFVTSIWVLPPPVFAGRVLSGRADRDREPRPRASVICLIVSGLCPIVTWLSQVSVQSCRGSDWSSLGSARSLSNHVGSLSDRHLAQPDLCPIVSGLCPIVIWLSQISVQSCRISVRSSFGSAWYLSDRAESLFDRHFCSASFFVWCVADPIHSVICYSGRVLSLISKVVFLAQFQVSGAVPSTVLRADS